MQDKKKRIKISRKKCCVFGCQNVTTNPGVKFYRFPTASKFFKSYNAKVERRAAWIKAVRLNNADGSAWVPKESDRICNQHFIGNQKSDEPASPSYIPRIFPPAYKVEVNPDLATGRYERAKKRRIVKNINIYNHMLDNPVVATSSAVNIQNLEEFQDESVLPQNKDTHIESDVKKEIVQQDQEAHLQNEVLETTLSKDQGTQVEFDEFCSLKEITRQIFICNLRPSNTNHTQCDAETQASEPLNLKKNKESTAPEDKNNSNSNLVNGFAELKVHDGIAGFKGYRSVTSDDSLNQVAGINMDYFLLLLSIISSVACPKTKKMISDENRLLIFLVKMKTGLTFSALGIFFGLHRTTISKIFYSTLEILAVGCKHFVPWPTQEEVRGTTPSCFKPDYYNCRLIIDATEFQMEQPPRIDEQVQCYSHYKSGYRIKFVIGCAPSGLVTFVSGGYGGRATDVQITAASDLFKLLENGDIVLADKEFPNIESKLLENGKNVLIVMPPFVENNQLSAEQRENQRKIARVRIHIERIMQRIRLYRIVDHFTVKMFPHVDNIVFMCCVLVNMQPPILKDDNDDF